MKSCPNTQGELNLGEVVLIERDHHVESGFPEALDTSISLEC